MKIEKNRNLKGSVLLTVVSIMALLILFLTSAMVLATASSRRAHRDYSSTQAEYTARTAVTAFLRAIENNDEARAAVCELQTPIYPVVQMGNESMGRLVRVDASGNDVWDEITVEPVLDDSGNPVKKPYYFSDGSSNRWADAEEIRIIATVKVGKERKTVTTYAMKSPSGLVVITSNNNSKGFQTAGGTVFNNNAGFITGSFNVGLENNTIQDFRVPNDTILYEDDNFANGSLICDEGGIYIYVKSQNSKTVITGDLTVKNHTAIIIDYPTFSPTKQSEVPYLFIEGCFKMAGDVDVTVGADESSHVNSTSPYNIFAGSVELKQLFMAGDLYIMDDDKDSVIGSDGGGAKLYSWTSSMSDPGTPYKSSGGNIYCRGNLKLIGESKIDGAVRVEKTLSIEHHARNMTFTGPVIANEVVLEDNSASKMTFVSDVYCNSYTIGSDSGTPDAAGTTVQGVTFYPLSRVASTIADGIYPNTMTKDEIYGQPDPADTDTGWTHGANQFIKNVGEIRKELGYDFGATGWDPQKYHLNLDSSIITLINNDASVKVPAAIDNNDLTINHATYPAYYENSILYIDRDINHKLTVKVAGSESLAIIFKDGVSINSNGLLIIDAPTNNHVELYIMGELKLDKGGIVTQELYDRIVTNGDKRINEWDVVNIDLYAANGSVLRFNNGGVIMANGYAPTLSIKGNTGAHGHDSFIGLSYYEGTETANTQVINLKNGPGQSGRFDPQWIGNAFVKGVVPDPAGTKDVPNNFTLLYTSNGGNNNNPNPPQTNAQVPEFHQRYFAEY